MAPALCEFHHTCQIATKLPNIGGRSPKCWPHRPPHPERPLCRSSGCPWLFVPEDGVELLLTARSQQRDIMEQAKVAAKGAVGRATAIAERGSSEDPSVRDVEYVRMFAKVAQVQFQAVLDALNEHVNRLSELSGIAGAPRSG